MGSGTRSGKDKQHPETAAVRLREGGNNVDEASRLALVDRAATLAHKEVQAGSREKGGPIINLSKKPTRESAWA